MSVLDGWRAEMIKDRAQFFKDVPQGPFFGFNRPGANLSQGLVDSWFQQGMQSGFKATYDCIKSWETDHTEDLKSMNIPVLVIQGDDDQIVPIKAGAFEVMKLLPNGKLKVYPGGSHALPDTEKDGLNDDLWQFLNE
jgi:non-heme chloroperoxidase